MSSSPPSVRVLSSVSISMMVEPAGPGRAETIAAAAPSANTEVATIVSGSVDDRRCRVQSSTHTISTTASGSAMHVDTAVRRAGKAP